MIRSMEVEVVVVCFACNLDEMGCQADMDARAGSNPSTSTLIIIVINSPEVK